MNPLLTPYAVALACLVMMVLALEGPWIEASLPIVIWIYLLREVGVYHGVLNEILLSVVVICLNEVKPLTVLYMIDRLTDMLITMVILMKKTTFRRPGDVQMGTVLLLFVILLEKVLWLDCFLLRRDEIGNPSALIMVLLYVQFGGNCLIRTIEWYS